MHGGAGAEEGFSKRRVERGEARGGCSSPKGHLQLAKAGECAAVAVANCDSESRLRKVHSLYSTNLVGIMKSSPPPDDTRERLFYNNP